jgi:hypothetical protein
MGITGESTCRFRSTEIKRKATALRTNVGRSRPALSEPDLVVIIVAVPHAPHFEWPHNFRQFRQNLGAAHNSQAFGAERQNVAR